jgi:hypothetical protein
MSELVLDDLVEAWIRAREYQEGSVSEYWSLRFDLMCLEFDIVPPTFDRDQTWLWEHGDRIASDSSHRMWAGVYEVPRVVADFGRTWNRRLMTIEHERSAQMREMLRDCVLTTAPHAERGSTTLDRLIELGLDPIVPDADDFF